MIFMLDSLVMCDFRLPKLERIWFYDKQFLVLYHLFKFVIYCRDDHASFNTYLSFGMSFFFFFKKLYSKFNERKFC